jgi:serine/threonine protein phosphatase 1
MVYYVVSDCHGFFTELYTALKEAGFFEEKEDCRLVVCGDVLDRGKEAIRMINFLLRLKNDGKLILITGNHEELLSKCLQDI